MLLISNVLETIQISMLVFFFIFVIIENSFILPNGKLYIVQYKFPSQHDRAITHYSKSPNKCEGFLFKVFVWHV